jgi:hypothetical protein
MKKFNLILASLFLLSSIAINAQKELTQGMVKMEVTEVNSDNPQIAAQMEMFKGTQTEYYFSDEKSLVNANMMGGMMKMQTLTNNADEHVTMLFEAMGQKMMIESTKEERAEMEAGQSEMADAADIIYDKNDTKEILGYKCYKATVKMDADPNMQMEFSMYITPELKASNKMIQGLQAYELEGFPLELVLNTDQMSLTTSAVDLKKEIDKSVFDLNTSGYTKMSFEEFQQSMGGMGGGMGF